MSFVPTRPNLGWPDEGNCPVHGCSRMKCRSERRACTRYFETSDDLVAEVDRLQAKAKEMIAWIDLKSGDITRQLRDEVPPPAPEPEPGESLIEWTDRLSPIAWMLIAGGLRVVTGNAWISVAMAVAVGFSVLERWSRSSAPWDP